MSFLSSVISAVRASSKLSFSSFCDRFIQVTLGIVVTLLPLWFLPFGVDVLDTHKQTFLVSLMILIVMAWIGRGLSTRSFSFTRSWLHLPILFFVVGYAVISLFSQDRMLSFLGAPGQSQWSVLTIASLAAFTFFLINELRERSQIFSALRWFFFGVVLVEIHTIFGFFNLPGGFFVGHGFTTIGTMDSVAVFLIAPMVVAMGLLLFVKEIVHPFQGLRALLWKGVLWAVLFLGIGILVVLDHWASWIGLAFGMLFLVAIPWFRRRSLPGSLVRWVPAVFFAVAVLFFFLNLPWQPESLEEVLPSMRHSWSIAGGALRDMPLVGSGPGTWALDYAHYRSAASNASPFWSVSFGRAASTALLLVPTMGLMGTMIIVLLLLSVLMRSVSFLRRESDEKTEMLTHVLLSGWITVILLAFLYPYALSHLFVLCFLLSLLTVVSAGESGEHARVMRVGAVVSFVSLVVLTGLFAALWLLGQRSVADIRYAQAARLPSVQASLDPSIVLLSKAIQLNPFVDQYYRGLSHASVARALGLFNTEQQPVNEAQQQSDIVVATSAAARAIQLGPANAENWASAASVYEALVRVLPNADLNAIVHLEQAIMRAPTSPLLMDRLGQVLLFRSDSAAQAASAATTDEARAEAQGVDDVALRGAEEWLTRAVNAKTDYAPARFHLAMVYDRQERTDEAVTLLTDLQKALPEDVTVRWALADVYEHAERFEEAIAQVQVIADTYPDDTAVAERLQTLHAAQQKAATPEASQTPAP